MDNIIKKCLILLLSLAALFVFILALRNTNEAPPDIPDTGKDIFGLIPPGDVMDMAFIKDAVYAGGRDGVYVIDRNNYQAEKLEFSTNITYVRALHADDEGWLWIGCTQGLMRYFPETKEENRIIAEKESIPDERVNSIMQDSKKRLWVGTWGGAACLEDGKWSVLTEDDGLMKNMVNVIDEDSEGGLWFGSYSVKEGGVSCLSNGQWQYFNTQTHLHNENVTSIMQAHNGDVWIGTGLYDHGGAAILRLDGFVWKLFGKMAKEDGLVGEKVRSLFQTREGTVIIGSEYNGLTCVKNGICSHLTMAEGLSDNEIKCILQDKEGRIWLGTRNGITVIANEEALFNKNP